jgi:hypothetical protein
MRILPVVIAMLLCAYAHAQVNSGSNGSDGAFNPTTNTVINMGDRPTGIYHYTSVNIPTNVWVTFIPNANNTPVVWLVQSNCVINGFIIAIGEVGQNIFSPGVAGGKGGPGGYAGGIGGVGATGGQGPGGGLPGLGVSGAGASYSTLGWTNSGGLQPGAIYGNTFLIPLLGGSGGGGSSYGSGAGGGGGGGAVLIAAANTIELNGYVIVAGSQGGVVPFGNSSYGGSGSGGALRLIASKILGSGAIDARDGNQGTTGNGRVRFDTLDNRFGGFIYGVFSQGFQPIIFPIAGQGAQLTVTTVGGVQVSASPTGVLSTPDAVLSAQQNNPISIVVNCANLPLNTQITVSVKPANGSAVTATGFNSTGTLASSTATVSIVIPRGGGLIYATAATSN